MASTESLTVSLLPSGSNNSNISTYNQDVAAVVTAHTIPERDVSDANETSETSCGSSDYGAASGTSYYEYRPTRKAGHSPFCACGGQLDCCGGCGGVLPPWKCGAEVPVLPVGGQAAVALVQKQGRFMLGTETRANISSTVDEHSSSSSPTFSLIPNRHSSGNGEKLLVYERLGATW